VHRKLPLFGFDFAESEPAIGFHTPLSPFKLRAFQTLPLFGFDFAEFEAAVHFHKALSQFKLGAFRTSRKLGLSGFDFSWSAGASRLVSLC
jgi:hypothetical protein